MIRLAEPTEDELRAVDTLAPGDYEIGFQRTNDILDEALRGLPALLALLDGRSRAT